MMAAAIMLASAPSYAARFTCDVTENGAPGSFTETITIPTWREGVKASIERKLPTFVGRDEAMFLHVVRNQSGIPVIALGNGNLAIGLTHVKNDDFAYEATVFTADPPPATLIGHCKGEFRQPLPSPSAAHRTEQ